MSGIRAAVGLALVAVAILALAAVLPALRPPPQALDAEDLSVDASLDPSQADPQQLDDLAQALDAIPPGPLEGLEEELNGLEPQDLQDLADAADQIDPEAFEGVEDLASLLEQAAAGDLGALEDAGLSPEAAQALQEAMQQLTPEQQRSLADAVAGLDPAAVTQLLQDADTLAGVDLQRLQDALASLQEGYADATFAQAVADQGLDLAGMAPWDRAVGPGALGSLPQHACPAVSDQACGGRLATYRLGHAGGNLTYTGPAKLVPWQKDPYVGADAVRTEVVLLADGRGVVPTLGPDDVLVSATARDQWGPVAADFYQNADGTVEIRSPATLVAVEVAVHTDLDYGIAAVPPGTPRHPSPPTLDPALQAAGLAIAAQAGLDRDDPVATQLNGLQAMLRAFGSTQAADPPATVEGLLAAARAHEGCAATRAALFVVAAEALGTPARIVRLQDGVAAEAELAGVGWRRMELGGCGPAPIPTPATPEGPPLTLDGAPTTVQPGEDVVLFGKTAPQTRVDIYLEQGAPAPAMCGTTSSRSGTFYAVCKAPETLRPGAATLRVRAGEPATGTATLEQPVAVTVPAKVTVQAPAVAAAGNPADVTATVRDLQGNPLPGLDVSVRLGGRVVGVGRTGPDGNATIPCICPEPGAYVLEAAGAGTSARQELLCQPSTLQAQVATGPPTGTVITGNYTGDPGNGTILVHADGATVAVPLRDGAFSVQPEVPLGPATATVTAPDGTQSVLRWTERATLDVTLHVPPQVEAGHSVPITLVGGKAPPPATLAILLDGAPWDTIAWDGTPIAGPILPAGSHTFTVTVLSDTWQPAAPLAATVVAGTHAIAWDDPPMALRHQDLTLAGTLTFDGQPAAGPVEAGLGAGMVAAEAGPDGRFSLTIPALRSNGTAATLLLESAPRLWREEMSIPLRDAPTVTLDAPGLAFVGLDGTLTVQADPGPDSRVRVTVDGEPLRGRNGTHRAGVSTWLVSLVTVEATASPVEGDIEPMTVRQTVLLVNPWTTGLLLAATAGGAIALVVRSRLQRRPTIELAEVRPGSARLLSPALPKHVPWVFDPAIDATLRFQSPGAVARVLAGDADVPFEAQGRELLVPVGQVPQGRQSLQFLDADGRTLATADLEVAPLHGHLDATMRGVAAQLRGRPRDGPVPLREFRKLLARSGVPARHADQVRSAFERTLFSGAPCDRPAFHACYAALGAAKEAQA